MVENLPSKKFEIFFEKLTKTMKKEKKNYSHVLVLGVTITGWWFFLLLHLTRVVQTFCSFFFGVADKLVILLETCLLCMTPGGDALTH